MIVSLSQKEDAQRPPFPPLVKYNTVTAARRDLYWFQLRASRKESSIVSKVLTWMALLTWPKRVKVEDEGVAKRGRFIIVAAKPLEGRLGAAPECGAKFSGPFYYFPAGIAYGLTVIFNYYFSSW